MYTHACVCALLSNFSSGNESEIDNLAGRSASSSNVPLLLSVQQKRKRDRMQENSTEGEIERERQREKEGKKEHNN